MVSQKLQNYLNDSKVEWRSIKHPPAYTAAEIAALAHIPGKELAKCVVVKIDGKLAMVIEPSNVKLNLQALEQWFGTKQVELASEQEFKSAFPDCEPGAMPPLNLFNMNIYEDDTAEACFSQYGKIAFNAGTHTDLVEMNYWDFKKLVHPETIHLHATEG